MGSVGGSSVVLCLIATCWFAHGATIFPANRLSIMEGAGFLTYLVPDQTQIGNSAKWIHCSLFVGGNSYSLDSDQVHTIGQLTTVQRFSADVCGIRVLNLRSSLGNEWRLSALDGNSNSVNETLVLSVIKPEQNNALNISISDTARSFTVTCPEASSRRYCRIVDEADNIYDGCSQSFEVTWNAARFRCRLLYWGDMDETETVIYVRVEKSKRPITWSTEDTDSHVVLNCHYNSGVNLCRAVPVASRKQMMLLDGHLTDRYSAYNTRITSGVCALEIQKPLAKEDLGVWRIYADLSGRSFTGCVFKIGDNGLEEATQGQPQLIEVFHDQRSSATTTTELTCEEPYPLDYCYLSGPQGSDFAPEDFSHLSTLGLCRFKVANITSGKWACGRNDNGGGEDRFTYYDVRVYDQPGRAITPEITASAGDKNRKLLCKTILELPVEICRFVSPAGDVHGLSENIIPTPDSRFVYHGQGLRAGECGMEIIELEKEDFGRWKCSIKVQGRDYTINVDVTEEVISQTTIVIIAIAVTVVVGLLGGFFVYKKMNGRRVRYRNNLGTSGGVSMSNSSDS